MICICDKNWYETVMNHVDGSDSVVLSSYMFFFGPVPHTKYRQTDCDAYEPTVQIAQVG